MTIPFLVEAPGTHPAIDVCSGPAQLPGLLDTCHLNLDTLITSAISIAITLGIAFFIRYRLRHGAPGKLQLVFELALDYVRTQVRELAHPDAAFVVPLAATIGLYILVANYLDFFPLGVFPDLVPANADWNQTLAMALVVIIWAEVYSIRVLGVRGFLRRFTKPFDMNKPMRYSVFLVLNIIEEVAKPLSLSLRLFGNIFAGVVMIFLIVLLLGQCSSLPYVGPVVVAPAFLVVWKGFDVLFIGAIQAFIFMLLTIVYFGQAREGLEEEHH